MATPGMTRAKSTKGTSTTTSTSANTNTNTSNLTSTSASASIHPHSNLHQGMSASYASMDDLRPAGVAHPHAYQHSHANVIANIKSNDADMNALGGMEFVKIKSAATVGSPRESGISSVSFAPLASSMNANSSTSGSAVMSPTRMANSKPRKVTMSTISTTLEFNPAMEGGVPKTSTTNTETALPQIAGMDDLPQGHNRIRTSSGHSETGTGSGMGSGTGSGAGSGTASRSASQYSQGSHEDDVDSVVINVQYHQQAVPMRLGKGRLLSKKDSVRPLDLYEEAQFLTRTSPQGITPEGSAFLLSSSPRERGTPRGGAGYAHPLMQHKLSPRPGDLLEMNEASAVYTPTYGTGHISPTYRTGYMSPTFGHGKSQKGGIFSADGILESGPGMGSAQNSTRNMAFDAKELISIIKTTNQNQQQLSGDDGQQQQQQQQGTPLSTLPRSKTLGLISPRSPKLSPVLTTLVEDEEEEADEDENDASDSDGEGKNRTMKASRSVKIPSKRSPITSVSETTQENTIVGPKARLQAAATAKDKSKSKPFWKK